MSNRGIFSYEQYKEIAHIILEDLYKGKKGTFENEQLENAATLFQASSNFSFMDSITLLIKQTSLPFYIIKNEETKEMYNQAITDLIESLELFNGRLESIFNSTEIDKEFLEGIEALK